MKKKMVAIMAAIMVLLCGTTVFAAPSVTAADLVEGVKATASNGVKVTLTEVTQQTVESAIAAAVKQDSKSDVLAVMEVNVPKGTGKVTITFEVPAIKKGDNIYLLHFNGQKWEKIIPDAVADGKVTATFTSLSPVAIVQIPSGEKLPQTGAVAVLPAIALICTAGAVGCARKVKFN